MKALNQISMANRCSFVGNNITSSNQARRESYKLKHAKPAQSLFILGGNIKTRQLDGQKLSSNSFLKNAKVVVTHR